MPVEGSVDLGWLCFSSWGFLRFGFVFFLRAEDYIRASVSCRHSNLTFACPGDVNVL